MTETQKFWLGSKVKKNAVKGELEKEISQSEKITLSQNLDKLFPKAEEVFNDEQQNEENKIEISIPNIETIFKKNNEGKIPN